MELRPRSSFYRLDDGDFETRQAIARAQEMTSRSLKLLAEPPPDTFLGQQHHDLIPLPHQSEQDGA